MRASSRRSAPHQRSCHPKCCTLMHFSTVIRERCASYIFRTRSVALLGLGPIGDVRFLSKDARWRHPRESRVRQVLLSRTAPLRQLGRTNAFRFRTCVATVPSHFEDTAPTGMPRTDHRLITQLDVLVHSSMEYFHSGQRKSPWKN